MCNQLLLSVLETVRTAESRSHDLTANSVALTQLILSNNSKKRIEAFMAGSPHQVKNPKKGKPHSLKSRVSSPNPRYNQQAKRQTSTETSK